MNVVIQQKIFAPTFEILYKSFKFSEVSRNMKSTKINIDFVFLLIIYFYFYTEFHNSYWAIFEVPLTQL